MIFVLIVLFIGLIAFEVPGMIKQQQWGELKAYGFWMLLAMGLTFAHLLELPIPNPNKTLEAIFHPIYEVVSGALS